MTTVTEFSQFLIEQNIFEKNSNLRGSRFWVKCQLDPDNLIKVKEVLQKPIISSDGTWHFLTLQEHNLLSERQMLANIPCVLYLKTVPNIEELFSTNKRFKDKESFSPPLINLMVKICLSYLVRFYIQASRRYTVYLHLVDKLQTLIRLKNTDEDPTNFKMSTSSIKSIERFCIKGLSDLMSYKLKFIIDEFPKNHLLSVAFKIEQFIYDNMPRDVFRITIQYYPGIIHDIQKRVLQKNSAMEVSINRINEYLNTDSKNYWNLAEYNEKKEEYIRKREKFEKLKPKGMSMKFFKTNYVPKDDDEQDIFDAYVKVSSELNKNFLTDEEYEIFSAYYELNYELKQNFDTLSKLQLPNNTLTMKYLHSFLREFSDICQGIFQEEDSEKKIVNNEQAMVILEKLNRKLNQLDLSESKLEYNEQRIAEITEKLKKMKSKGLDEKHGSIQALNQELKNLVSSQQLIKDISLEKIPKDEINLYYLNKYSNLIYMKNKFHLIKELGTDAIRLISHKVSMLKNMIGLDFPVIYFKVFGFIEIQFYQLENFAKSHITYEAERLKKSLVQLANFTNYNVPLKNVLELCSQRAILQLTSTRL